jgi:hypothetical protein
LPPSRRHKANKVPSDSPELCETQTGGVRGRVKGLSFADQDTSSKAASSGVRWVSSPRDTDDSGPHRLRFIADGAHPRRANVARAVSIGGFTGI